MAYTPQTWVDAPATTTPLSAARLTVIENGIQAAAAVADAAQPLNANLTQIAALVDPNADRLMFWDDSAGTWTHLVLGTNLSITGTTINAAGGAGSGDVVGPASATDNAVARYDTTTGKLLQTSLASVDDSGNVSALNTFVGFLSTATSAGTLTLTVASPRTQELTGTTTHTVRLPTTSVPQGAEWEVVNNSTGVVTVQSSGANTVLAMGAATRAVFTAKVATPTTAANWASAITGGTYQAPISLTTTGTSGAATFAGNVLNVPQYTGSAGGSIAGQYVVDTYPGANAEAKILAARTARGTNPGNLVFGAGTYIYTTTITCDRAGQGIIGQGGGATILDFRGTGDAIRMWDSIVPTDSSTSPGLAGPLHGVRITGDNNTNTAVKGLHIGDLFGISIRDVQIDMFDTTNSIGFWGENVRSWSERMSIQNLIVSWCYTGYVFDRNASNPMVYGSWAYSDMSISVECAANRNGIIITNWSSVYGERLMIVANCGPAAPATSNSGVVLTVGTSPTDESNLEGWVYFAGESGGTASWIGHYDINVGAAASITANGELNFAALSAPFQAGTGNHESIRFGGRINTACLGKYVEEYTFAVTNQMVVGRINNAMIGLKGVIGEPPQVFVDGADANIPMTLVSKGTGGLTMFNQGNLTSIPLAASSNVANCGWNLTTTGTGVVQANGVAVATVNERTSAMAFSATPTFALASFDTFLMAAMTASITSATFTGGNNGKSYTLMFLANGAYTIALGASVRLVGVTIPTTVSGKYLYLTGKWNTTDNKLHILGVTQEA